MEKRALGKGLAALLPETGGPRPREREVQDIPLEQIVANRYQPRTEFSEAELLELAESVKQSGLLQPVVVRRKGDGTYELIAGERRYRAARLAGLSSLPALVRNSTDQEAMVLALIENLQRKDLNPMESARAYVRLMNEFGLTQEMVAKEVGKDRSSIANLVRLTNLPKEIQDLLETGAITTGHAKVLLGLPTTEAQLRLANQIVEGRWSVRQTELMAAEQLSRRAPRRTARRASPYADLEARLQRRLGTRVALIAGRRGGKIVLHYFTPEERERLLELLLQ